jgi:hypothetical protein
MNHPSKKYLAVICTLLGLFTSCATQRAAYYSGYDFSKVKTIEIGEFSSAPNQSNSGQIISSEFIRQLLTAGYKVRTNESEDVDLVISGNVLEFQPNRRYLIVDNPQGQAQNVIVNQPPIEIGGSNTYNLGSAFGLGDNSKVVVSNATIGVSAFLKDKKTGEIIWSNSYTYEGLDLESALSGAVGYLTKSIPRNASPR